MGSQEVYDKRLEAPVAIVIHLRGERRVHFFVGQRGSAWQPDRTGGGIGPVAVTYTIAPGPGYKTLGAAQKAVADIIARARLED